jgi:hypothetical protein
MTFEEALDRLRRAEEKTKQQRDKDEKNRERYY